MKAQVVVEILRCGHSGVETFRWKLCIGASSINMIYNVHRSKTNLVTSKSLRRRRFVHARCISGCRHEFQISFLKDGA